jgi:hypothetical protein
MLKVNSVEDYSDYVEGDHRKLYRSHYIRWALLIAGLTLILGVGIGLYLGVQAPRDSLDLKIYNELKATKQDKMVLSRNYNSCRNALLDGQLAQVK